MSRCVVSLQIVIERTAIKPNHKLYDRGKPVYQTIDLIAVLVTVLLTGSELAIGVFVHPVSQNSRMPLTLRRPSRWPDCWGRSCRFGTRPHCS